MGILLLLAQCVTMFIASFVAGSLPLMFKSAMQGRRLKAISVLGMGLLVGAALTIIIPEGISTLYEALPAESDASEEKRHEHEAKTTRTIGLSLLSGFALMLLIESLTPHPPHPDSNETPCSSPPSPSTPLNPSSSRNSSESNIRPHPQHLNSSSPIIPKHMHIHDGAGDAHLHRHSRQGWNGSGLDGLNATLGLVIHGAADGIALGASSLSGRGSLGLVVFLAVLVHKGPTALGLTTTLLSLKLKPPQIRKRLIIFSFAAPIGAILTYLVVRTFGGINIGVGSGRSEIDGLGWWTGIALLFSGGSFLYVATVIQPLSATSSEEHSHAGHTHAEGQDEETVMGHMDGENELLGKYARTGLLILGMVCPVLLGALVGGHSH